MCVVCGAERPEVTIVWHLRSYGHNEVVRFLVCSQCLPGWAESPGARSSSEEPLPDNWEEDFDEACTCGRMAAEGPDPVLVVWRQEARAVVRVFCSSVCTRRWLLQSLRAAEAQPAVQGTGGQLVLF